MIARYKSLLILFCLLLFLPGCSQNSGKSDDRLYRYSSGTAMDGYAAETDGIVFFRSMSGGLYSWDGKEIKCHEKDFHGQKLTASGKNLYYLDFIGKSDDNRPENGNVFCYRADAGQTEWICSAAWAEDMWLQEPFLFLLYPEQIEKVNLHTGKKESIAIAFPENFCLKAVWNHWLIGEADGVAWKANIDTQSVECLSETPFRIVGMRGQEIIGYTVKSFVSCAIPDGDIQEISDYGMRFLAANSTGSYFRSGSEIYYEQDGKMRQVCRLINGSREIDPCWELAGDTLLFFSNGRVEGKSVFDLSDQSSAVRLYAVSMGE